MNSPSEAGNNSFEIVDFFGWTTFTLYRWEWSQDAFLAETWLRTVDCPEAYQTYGDVVAYLGGILRVQKCDNPVDMDDWSTLLYAMKKVAWSETGKLQRARDEESCVGTGYMCIARLIKAAQIPPADKIKYVAWLNRWYISEPMIRFLWA